MKRKHKMFRFTMALVLLVTLSGMVGSVASSKGSVGEEAGIEAGNEYKVVTATDVKTVEEIIPGDRKIDWDYASIPGGIPERTGVWATIDSAVFSNRTIDTRGAIQAALNSCPDGQVGYVPEGTYIVIGKIHLYDYDTLSGAWPGKTFLKHAGWLF